MVSHLSGSPFLTSGSFLLGCDQTGNEFLVPSCLVRSILAHTSLLMAGGTIPANKYKSSTYVGLRHHVIARHALFSSGSNMYAYVDLAHHILLSSSTGPVPLFL